MKTVATLLLSAVLSGCGLRHEYLPSELVIERNGWDSLSVEVGFAEKTLFGEPTPAFADSIVVRLFSATFDTLYVGHDSLIVVPDRRLGDRERALVEACGFFGRQVVCNQQRVEASPKRLVVESKIEYPEEDDYDIGTYEFSYSAERKAFDSDDWHPIEMVGVSTRRLSVRVLGEEGVPLEVPLRSDRGRFQLTNLPNNADYRRDLLAQLLDSDEATIRFELYSTAFNLKGPVWVGDTVVESKTEETRELEAGYFVEEAGSKVLELLRTFPVGPNVYLFMDSWTFDREARLYTITFSLSWQSSFLRSRWFELAAELHVAEDGTSPTVRLLRANERGERRWEQRFDGPDVTLDPLRPGPESRSARRGEQDADLSD
jgi:hypothetical protein